MQSSHVILNRTIQSKHDFKMSSLRDLRLRLYEIKRGETKAATVIDNELAAKLLLSFDLRQPYTAHQTYKLFDDLYGDIFARREVTAIRIEVIFIIYQKVLEALNRIENKSLANYKLTQFFLLHLIAEALRTSDAGKAFLQNSAEFVGQKYGFKVLGVCIDQVLNDLITDLNGGLKDRETEWKSN